MSKPAWERLDAEGELAQLRDVRLRNLVEVREPLVLISQVQRSGGTLLSQLFDAHPECHAHPGELHIGKPKKWDWPPLDLAQPETWFPTLFEKPAYKAFRDGYAKPSRPEHEHDTFPFAFLPSLQQAIFDACVAERAPHDERGVLDCYFTSYFNAWLDNANLYTGPKRVVTAFAARLSIEPANVESFFAAYPDGYLVSVVRDPRGWFASARRHRTHYHDLDEALELWSRSTQAALDAADRRPDRVVLLAYEQLVRETQQTMGRLAAMLGIAPDPCLLVPTFNGLPIRANSSASPEVEHGILTERADASRVPLSDAEAARIEEVAGDLHRRAVARTMPER